MRNDRFPAIDEPLLDLLNYCKENQWAGFDPYDALNSPIFARTPFSRSRVCRVALTQLLKRFPVNIRPILGISKEQNPKAIALFLMALLKLSRLGVVTDRRLIDEMVRRLVALRSPDSPYWCWGYSFPWQTRTHLVPRGAPNLVCTSFVAEALLRSFEATGDRRHRDMAISAAEYILNELYWSESGPVAGFSYPVPGLRTQVHNANFLASALLCRAYRACGDERLLAPALKAARYSAAAQATDGSWMYGESTKQGWVDHFHTGYNLCALRSIAGNAGTTEFDATIRNGFHFYRTHLFDGDGVPKYFSNRRYPVDAHCVAQSMITLIELKDLGDDNLTLANSVFAWAMKHMWDERGYFYYQVLPVGTIKLSYMRWTQAWMLLALSTLFEHHQESLLDETGSEGREAVLASSGTRH